MVGLRQYLDAMFSGPGIRVLLIVMEVVSRCVFVVDRLTPGRHMVEKRGDWKKHVWTSFVCEHFGFVLGHVYTSQLANPQGLVA